MKKLTKFELQNDGSINRVGPFGSYGPTIEASTKVEAQTRFLAFAFRAIENTPRVKLRKGAYQLAFESMYGVNVEAGFECRNGALCYSGVKDWSDLNDTIASFDYYASPEYAAAQETPQPIFS